MKVPTGSWPEIITMHACILEIRKNIDPANGRRYFEDKKKNHIINDSNRYTFILT